MLEKAAAEKKPKTGSSRQAVKYRPKMPPELAGGRFSALLGLFLFAISVALFFIWWPLGILVLAMQISRFVKSLKSPAGLAKRHFLEGTLALQKMDYQKALDSFTTVLKIKPEAVSLFKDIAYIHRQTGNFEKAAKALEKYLERYPEDAAAKFSYATTLTATKNSQKAIEILQSLPSEIKQDLMFTNALASAYLDLGNAEAAIAALKEKEIKRGATTDENVKLYHYLSGLAYKELGETQKAAEHFRLIYEEDKGFADVEELLEEMSLNS